MDNFSFARRTDWPREANALSNALEILKKQGVALLDLTVSNPTECQLAYPEGMLEALKVPENFHYQPEACGITSARQAVAGYYARQGLQVPPQDIVLTASTSEAYSFLMRLLVNPGEKVLIPRPSYPLFQFLLELNDVHFDYYPLIYDGQWHPDLAALERTVDAQTRAVIVVNPNNPTGSYLSRTELNRLNDICRKHRLSIIADEVFFDYACAPGDFISCAGNKSVLTFVLGGLSKTLALPQMKCAWIAASGPQEVLHESLARLEIIADTYLSVNTPVQNALGKWLEAAPAIQAQIKARINDNSRWLREHTDGHTEVLSFQGGWYATLRIPAIRSEEEWVLEFLKEDRVSVYPGYFFDFDGEAYIVLSLLPQTPVFQQAAGRILQRLARI